MVVIYTQDGTYIRKDVNSARNILIAVYGKKLGEEACDVLKYARNGMTYRKFGGPLVRVVTETEVLDIRSKESTIGMMR